MKTKSFVLAVVSLMSIIGCNKNIEAVLDYVPLESLIEECRAELSTAVEGGNLGEYVVGSKEILTSAVEEAEYVKANADRQSAIDNYVIKLTKALGVFRESKVKMASPYFNGTSAYINCGDGNALIGHTYTIELWVNMDEASGSGAAIVGAEGTDGTIWDGLIIRKAEGREGAIDFCVVNNTWSSCLTPENSFTYSKWTHIACTFDGTNAKIYLDGEESGSLTISEYQTKIHGCLIVGDMNHFKPRYFKGSVYDLRIWNVVRTAEQIAENKDKVFDEVQEGLVANWTFNVRSGDNNVDLTGNHTALLNDISWMDLIKE